MRSLFEMTSLCARVIAPYQTRRYIVCWVLSPGLIDGHSLAMKWTITHCHLLLTRLTPWSVQVSGAVTRRGCAGGGRAAAGLRVPGSHAHARHHLVLRTGGVSTVMAGSTIRAQYLAGFDMLT